MLMLVLKIGFCAVFLHEVESHFYSSLLVFTFSFILFHLSDIYIGYCYIFINMLNT